MPEARPAVARWRPRAWLAGHAIDINKIIGHAGFVVLFVSSAGRLCAVFRLCWRAVHQRGGFARRFLRRVFSVPLACVLRPRRLLAAVLRPAFCAARLCQSCGRSGATPSRAPVRRRATRLWVPLAARTVRAAAFRGSRGHRRAACCPRC